MSERTARGNQIRGLLMEYGVVIAPGLQRLRRALPAVLDCAQTLPTLAPLARLTPRTDHYTHLGGQTQS